MRGLHPRSDVAGKRVVVEYEEVRVLDSNPGPNPNPKPTPCPNPSSPYHNGVKSNPEPNLTLTLTRRGSCAILAW